MARAAEGVRRIAPDRVPPHNLEAEESVLGSMMLSAEAIADVVEILHPEDFYRSANGKIFEVLRSIYARGEPVDAITAVEELRRRGILEEVGGHLYIHELVEQVPTPAAAASYARIVSQHALLRRLISAAADIMEMGYSVPEDPERVADEAEQRIYEVARRDEKDQIATLRELVDQAILDLEHIQNRESAFAGLPTGFRDLDALLSGLQAGNLIVVAARPGVGKSSFVTNLARNVAVDSKTPVAMFSLEMSRWEIGMRLLCAEARVPWDAIRNKRVGAEHWAAIAQAAEVLHDAPLTIVDSGNVTIVDIRAKARRLATRRDGLGLIIVDYLQLMSHHRRVENRQQEIAEISRSLKLLAKELHIPVIAVSQLNRDPERRQDKRPQLSDLRECVAGETHVMLADGRRVPIRELVGTTPEVLAMSPEGRIVRAVSDMVWPVGMRPLLRIRLASGREIRCTADHRLYAASGWMRAGELAPGDRLAVARRTLAPREPVTWPDAHVALLGHLVGDGSYLIGQPLRYTTASEDNSELVARAAASLGSRVRRVSGRGRWHQLVISGNGSRWHPAGVGAWLRSLGVFGQRSHEKRLPEVVFRFGDRQVGLLLRHLWATDGCIQVRRGKGSHRVYLASSSRGLVEDVAALLLRLGIVGRIRHHVSAKGRSWFTVDVTGSEFQRRFLTRVGAFGPRTRPAEMLRQALAEARHVPNVDTLPTLAFEQVREAMREHGVTTRAMAALRGTAYGGGAHFSFAPSRALLAEYADLLHDDGLRMWAESDLFWDRVVGIAPAGEDLVYDLTVPGPASWLADGIVSHNSGAIEQDADVVMFIHRDDSVAEKKGLAELIVAKHRNGPTDTVPLTFLPHLTQFRNYAPSTG